MKSLLKGMGIGLAAGAVILIPLCLYFIFLFPGNGAPSGQDSQSQELASGLPEDTLPSSEDLEEDAALAEGDGSPSGQEEALNEPAEEPETEPEPVPDTVISFAGDVMFPSHYLSAYDQGGIRAIADEGMLAHMQESDLFVLNEEFPYSLRGEPMPDKQYTFRTDPKYVTMLQDLGADIVTVANNHALDFGQDAFCDTLDTLMQADIACIGGGYDIAQASAPAIRTVNGQTFAFLGATRVSPAYEWYATDSQPGLFQTYDPTLLNQRIAEADAQYDHVIVFVHWGIERNETPEEYQRVLAQGYIEAGADLIVGCHPHVLQGFEYYQGVPIVYSLGNYLFDSRTGETVLLKAIFSPEGDLSLQLIPCRRESEVLTQMENPSSLYQHLTELSFGAQVSEDGMISAGN